MHFSMLLIFLAAAAFFSTALAAPLRFGAGGFASGQSDEGAGAVCGELADLLAYLKGEQ